MSTQIAIQTTNDPLGLVLAAIQNDTKLQPSTKHQYSKAVVNYVEAGHSLTDAQALTTYAATVGGSTRSFLKAAIGKLCKAIEHQAKTSATPDNVAAIQAVIYRAEALQESVIVEQAKGAKAHTWLSQAQVKTLLDGCGDDLVGQRDRIAIGLCVAAGLRRQEAVTLSFSDIVLQPIAGKMRTVLNVKGKGAKDRVVPISDSLANAITEWSAVTGGDGLVVRSLGRSKRLGEKMSGTALYKMVEKRGRAIDKDDLQPHDLRRTFAQLGYNAGVPIAQISILLGHASIETTMTYLNVELNLESTVSDFVPF